MKVVNSNKYDKLSLGLLKEFEQSLGKGYKQQEYK